MSLSFEKIEDALEGQVVVHNPCFKNGLASISTDSRVLKEGEVFLALSGDFFDGVDFIPSVLEKKPSLIIASRKSFFEKNLDKINYGNVGVFLVDDALYAYGEIAKVHLRSFKGKKIAITGSAGKTTVKDLLAQLLGMNYRVFWSEKNYNNQIGLPKNILSITQDADYFIFEIGTNRSGEIKRLSEIIAPDIGVVTNVLSAHIGMFENKEALVEEKFSIINSMEKGSVFVLDDLESSNLLEKRAKERSLDFKKMSSNYLRLESFEENGGIKTYVFRGQKKLIEIPLTSAQNAKNLSLAVQISEILGAVSLEEMIGVLPKLQFPRFLVEFFKDGSILIDDAYNANLESMFENVEWLVQLPTSKKKIFILGDIKELGDKEKAMHIQLGAVLRKKYGRMENVQFNFVGPLMRHAFKSSSLPYRAYFLRAEEVGVFFRDYLEKNAVYYLKASNAMKFHLAAREIKGVLSRCL